MLLSSNQELFKTQWGKMVIWHKIGEFIMISVFNKDVLVVVPQLATRTNWKQGWVVVLFPAFLNFLKKHSISLKAEASSVMTSCCASKHTGKVSL